MLVYCGLGNGFTAVGFLFGLDFRVWNFVGD